MYFKVTAFKLFSTYAKSFILDLFQALASVVSARVFISLINLDFFGKRKITVREVATLDVVSKF